MQDHLSEEDAFEAYDQPLSQRAMPPSPYMQGLNQPQHEAVEALDMANKLDREQADTHFARAQALHRSGRLEEALSAYERAIDLPETPDVSYLNQGLVLADLGRVDAAIAALERSLEDETKPVLCLLRLSELHEGGREGKGAICREGAIAERNWTDRYVLRNERSKFNEFSSPKLIIT